MTQPRKHPASLSSCLPKGNGIQGILPLSKHHPAVLSQLQPFFLFLEILQRIPRPFQAPPEELSYGTRRTKSPSCKSPRSPPHVDFLLQTELTLHSPTANWGFFLIPPPFPAGLISLKFTGISPSDFHLLPGLAASSRNLSQASFSWETRPKVAPGVGQLPTRLGSRRSNPVWLVTQWGELIFHQHSQHSAEAVFPPVDMDLF